MLHKWQAMHSAIRFFLLFVLLSTHAWAEWRSTKEIRLKKDQFEQVVVNSEGQRRLLQFRWTLYHNERLVVFKSFDGIVSQHVLALNHHNQSFRVQLVHVPPKNMKIPFILVKFKTFDYETNEAVFEFMVRDEEEAYVLNFLNEKMTDE